MKSPDMSWFVPGLLPTASARLHVKSGATPDAAIETLEGCLRFAAEWHKRSV